MSDRLALIQPLITPAVKKLIAQRLAKHVALIREDVPVTEKKRIDTKIALLAVHIINPFEEFYPSEEALIRGISVDTLNKRKAESRRDAHAALKRL